MTPAEQKLARLWYGNRSIEAVAKEMGWSETRVRVEAVEVLRLGPRTEHMRNLFQKSCPDRIIDDRRTELGDPLAQKTPG